MVEEQTIAEKEKSCYLFCILHNAHEFESKTFQQNYKEK